MTEKIETIINPSDIIEEKLDVSSEKTECSKREKARQKQQAVNELLERLSQTYPEVFVKAGEGRAVPLAIGLHKLLQPIVMEWGFNSMILRTAMFNYTRQLRYQNALLYATHRINLDGSQAEEITTEQKEAAKTEIAKIEAWLAKNRPEKAQRLLEKRAEVAEKRQARNVVNKQKKAKPTARNVSNKASDSKQTVQNKASNKSTPQNIEEKMQSLLSKFNQY